LKLVVTFVVTFMLVNEEQWHCRNWDLHANMVLLWGFTRRAQDGKAAVFVW